MNMTCTPANATATTTTRRDRQRPERHRGERIAELTDRGRVSPSTSSVGRVRFGSSKNTNPTPTARKLIPAAAKLGSEYAVAGDERREEGVGAGDHGVGGEQAADRRTEDEAERERCTDEPQRARSPISRRDVGDVRLRGGDVAAHCPGERPGGEQRRQRGGGPEARARLPGVAERHHPRAGGRERREQDGSAPDPIGESAERRRREELRERVRRREQPDEGVADAERAHVEGRIGITIPKPTRSMNTTPITTASARGVGDGRGSGDRRPRSTPRPPPDASRWRDAARELKKPGRRGPRARRPRGRPTRAARSRASRGLSLLLPAVALVVHVALGVDDAPRASTPRSPPRSHAPDSRSHSTTFSRVSGHESPTISYHATIAKTALSWQPGRSRTRRRFAWGPGSARRRVP